MKNDNLHIYAYGMCYLSACAPAGMTRAVVEHRANIQNPTGIRSRWKISKDATFKTGEPNPTSCEDEPGRVHYLLDC